MDNIIKQCLIKTKGLPEGYTILKYQYVDDIAFWAQIVKELEKKLMIWTLEKYEMKLNSKETK